MANRRGRGNRRFTRADREYVWAGLLTTGNALAGGAAEENAIVTGPDWFGAAGSGEATLLRIRGTWSFVVTPGAALSVNVEVMIYKTTIAAPAIIVPWAVNTLVIEDILWHEVRGLGRDPTTYQLALNYDIDTKAKRRMDDSEEVRFAISTNVAGAYNLATRALVQL